MKNLTKFFAIAVVILGFSANSFAQDSPSATATASAIITTGIQITNAADMLFGTIANTGGTVILTPLGTIDVTSTSPTPTGTITAASFNLTGANNEAYTLSIPTANIDATMGGELMTVGSWTSIPSTTAGLGTGVLLADGSGTISVGATLTITPGQPSGTYITAPFEVTINY